MKKLKVGFIGMGNRGGLYHWFASDRSDVCEVSAIVDFKLDLQLSRIGKTNAKHLYTNTDDFFKDALPLDLLCVSSMDKYHYQDALRALNLGYNILLEKPISCKMEEVLHLERVAEEKNLKVVVCHVLRYTLFYKKIKELIDGGTLGNIVNINCTENVAYWHQCHSYVRGNWHSTKETAPQILTKCSHDLDIIQWLMNKKVVKVQSFGDQFFFKKENKPSGSSTMCYNCPINKECDFNAYKFYLKNRDWLIPFAGKDLTDERIDEFLRNSDFGHCAFDMDNDTVDHQVVNILFEDNTTSTLTMNAFSNDCYRDIKVYGTKGDLIGNFEDKIIKVNLFNGEKMTFDISKMTDDFSGHGGGDRIMFNEFIDYILYGKKTPSLTLLTDSVISHKMAFLSEKSRLNGGMPLRLEDEN